MSRGVVIRVDGPSVIARVEAEEIRASLRGALKTGPRMSTHPVAVGDRIELARGAEGGWVVTAVAPRVNLLARVDPGDPRRCHAIAANLDQVLCLQAFRDPPLNLRGLDRLLLLGLAAGVSSLAVVNKIDLLHGSPPPLLGFYETIGVRVLLTSARHGTGIGELATALARRITAVIGPSGAGKSSLLNALVPGLRLRIGAVSKATSKGVHTTARVEWVDLPGGGVALDTPGIRTIQPWGIDAGRLPALWPEFQGLPPCRFEDCRHRAEPGCVIRQEVEAGRLPAPRYDSYLRIMASMEQSETAKRRLDHS